MANNHIASLSLNPTSISDLTGVNVSEGMQRNLVNNAQRQAMSMVKASFAANAGTITSASTIALASISTGDYILLTASGGSSSISSFGTGVEGLSKQIEAIGSIVLRASANLLTPAGADLSLSTGDVINVRSMGTTVWKIRHSPYSGIPNAIQNAVSASVSATTKLLSVTGGILSTALVSEIVALGAMPTNHITGLVLSNNGADANNDIDISAGAARDSTDADNMICAALTKRLDANWAVGTNQGGLDTGAEASSTHYYLWLIKRVDTGVVDVLFSASATAPTMPANYTLKRLIGAVYNNGSSNLTAFHQRNSGRYRIFTYDTPFIDVDDDAPGTSAVTRTLTVPTLGVTAIVNAGVYNDSGTVVSAYLSALDQVDLGAQLVGTAALTLPATVSNPGSALTWVVARAEVQANTSSQIRSRCSASSASSRIGVITLGWGYEF